MNFCLIFFIVVYYVQRTKLIINWINKENRFFFWVACVTNRIKTSFSSVYGLSRTRILSLKMGLVRRHSWKFRLNCALLVTDLKFGTHRETIEENVFSYRATFTITLFPWKLHLNELHVKSHFLHILEDTGISVGVKGWPVAARCRKGLNVVAMVTTS